MAFIRSKGKRGWRGDLTSHYLVESRRVNGKVRQKVLLYLGPCDSIKSALMHFRQQAWYWQKRAQGYALRYLYTPRTRDGRQWRNGEEFKIVPSALTSAELEQATKELKLGLKCILEDDTKKLAALNKRITMRAQKDRTKRCTKIVRQNTVAARKCEKFLRKVKPDTSMAICNCHACQHARRCMWALETRLDSPTAPTPAALGGVVPTPGAPRSAVLGTTGFALCGAERSLLYGGT